MIGKSADVCTLPLIQPHHKVPKFKFNGTAQARAHCIRRKIKLIHGGFGSGKSVLLYLHCVEQSVRDTDQLHGVFTHTRIQFTAGVLPDLQKRLKRSGILIEFNVRPDQSWFRYWQRAGIEIPYLKSYAGVVTLSTGLHLQHGTFHNQSFKQFHSVSFRTLWLDEMFSASLAAVQELLPRCRCGDADDDEDVLADSDVDDAPNCGHLHGVTLLGNPPLGAHWIFEWLDKREAAARRNYDGPEVDHQNWELLRRGVGRMIMVRVPTRDNVRNVGRAYVEELEDGFSGDVAKRYLDGEIVRESAGRAFTEYSSARNVSPVPYDPDRAVYVWLDFDLAPRAAVFCHLLERGEYPPQEAERDDRRIIHFGVFGEFFNEREMSNRDFALNLIRGGRGAGGDCEYEDPVLRGLPQNWDGLRSHRGTIIFSGDARGKDKSRHHDELSSDWKMVRDTVAQEIPSKSCVFDIPEGNSEPAVRIHALNSKFCNVGGVRAIHMDPITKHLQRDAESCEWDADSHDLRHCGRGFGGTLWMRTHLIVGLGYGVNQVSPMGRDRAPGVDRPRANLRGSYVRPELV